jgi:hypothetical protein
MKNLTLLFLVLSFAPFAHAETVVVTLDEVSARVKAQDFTLLENAQRVYQSKEAIQVARMNLLPRLNLWSIVGVAVDWKNAVGLIEDLVPFLVPNNWFRVKQQQLFHEAERLGFKALQANEILTARAIYLQTIMDEELTEQLNSSIQRVSEAVAYTRLQEQFGEVPAGTSASIEAKFLSLLDDHKKMENLVYDEKRGLALMIGVPVTHDLVLIKPLQPRIDELKHLDLNELVSVVIAASPEIAQFDYLISAARYVKREVYFSFLGISNLTRGIMGGVFDQYPVQSGLGFGMGASVRIVRSQTAQIRVQKDAATEVVKKQLAIMVKNYNSGLDTYSNVQNQLIQAKRYQESLANRIRLGEKISAIELMDGVKTLAEAETRGLALRAELNLNLDRVNRLQFQGPYANLQVLTEATND